MRCLMTSLALIILSFFCTPGPVGSEQEILVSAAISLKNAFTDMGKLFAEGHPGVKVNFNFGASGDLATQILGGAPVTVFASAAQKDMQAVEKAGLLVPGSRADFAGNGVVLVQPRKASLTLSGFADLVRPQVRKVAIGNPQTVPAGRYAMEVLTYLKLADPLQDKLVLAENVRQVLDYVARGEVDAGLVYETDALARSQEVQVIDPAPIGSHKPVVYPLALIKGAADEAAAREFVALILSAQGRSVLQKYGFRPVSAQ